VQGSLRFSVDRSIHLDDVKLKAITRKSLVLLRINANKYSDYSRHYSILHIHLFIYMINSLTIVVDFPKMIPSDQFYTTYGNGADVLADMSQSYRRTYHDGCISFRQYFYLTETNVLPLIYPSDFISTSIISKSASCTWQSTQIHICRFNIVQRLHCKCSTRFRWTRSYVLFINNSIVQAIFE
jgi:hypothetical protein